MYVQDTIPCNRRTDLEVRDLESVWVELQVKCKRILAGGFYKPPNSSPDYFKLLKESIDRACDTDIIDIIITGDFNCNMAQSIPNKMRELMSEFSDQFKKIVKRYIMVGYNLDIMRQSACLV